MHLHIFSYLEVRGKIKVKIWLLRKKYVVTSSLASQSCPVSGNVFTGFPTHLELPYTVVNFWATQSYSANAS